MMQPKPLADTVTVLLSLAQELAGRDPQKASDLLAHAAELARSLGHSIEECRALRLRGAVEVQRGNLPEAETVLLRSLALARELGARPELASSLTSLGILRLRQGRADEGRAALREALGLTTEVSSADPAGIVRAETLEALGLSYRDRGQASQALRFYQEALEIRRGAEDEPGIAACLNQMGNLRHRIGQYQEAVSCFRTALDTRRKLGDRRGIAATTNNLGMALLFAGERDESGDLLRESRQLFEALGETGTVATCLSNLGTLAWMRGRMEEAEVHYRESLRIHRDRGDPAGQANALNNLSNLAVERGHPEEAIACAEESRALRDDAGLEASLAKPLCNLGWSVLETGPPERARAIAEEALGTARRAESEALQAEALTLLAAAELGLGHVPAALEAAGEAASRADRTEDPKLRARCRHTLGVVHLERGDLDEAKETFAAAARLMRGWDHPYENARIIADQGRLLARAGSPEAAAERLRRAEQEFAFLGNARWRIRVLLDLARVLEPDDPSQAALCRGNAHEVARAANLLPFLGTLREAEPPGTEPFESSGALDELATALVGAGAGHEPDPESCMEAMFQFLRKRKLAARARFHPHPEAARLFRADGREWTATAVFEPIGASGPRAAGREYEVTGTRGPVGKLEIDRVCEGPIAREESEALAVALKLLGLALGLHLERAERHQAGEILLGDVDRLEDLVGASPAMKDVFRTIARLAPSEASVLILGESGTGKELAARAIHLRGRRAGGPFVAINCPSIPRDLIESELFGSEKGAFTGATTRPGKLESAEGGTLFLDEVGDMAPGAQVKLLRFLQEREFQRVGGTTNRRVDVRVLAATSRDLSEAMARGEFREDLYFRLNVIPLRMPSLRERREDIPLLVEHVLQGIVRETGLRRRISVGALDRLRSYDWPGNVRELANVVEYMLTMSDGEMIEACDVPNALTSKSQRDREASRAPMDLGGAWLELRPGETLHSRLVQVEAALIRAALEAEGWNQSAAARRLGISEGKVRYRMQQYGIHHDAES